MSFVHLHLHTEWSLLDGVSKIKPLVKRVKELGMPACAITDHGVMYGAYDFWHECKDQGVKPIIGCEVYVASRDRHGRDSVLDKERYHLTLLAQNLEGYHNLVKMVSVAHLEGFYYKPRIDRELIQQYGKGIIALTGCLSSNFSKLLASGKREEAVEWVKFMTESFSQVYVEIQRNGIQESEDLIPLQMGVAKELNLPVVATCDAHYIEPKDYELQEIVWCISDGTQLNDPRRRQYGSREFFVKGPEDMQKLYADIPEVVENTVKLAESVEDYSIEFSRIQPKYDPKMSPEETKATLDKKAWDGLAARYEVITDEMKQRVAYELSVINDKGYNDYFLVVQDYINWARSQGILVGPGRGSGAGSVVAYSLGITNICPFTYNLIFERFLNPERPSPPDFDVDFQDNRRDELFDYMSERYGHDHTAFIGTFGKLQTRAAIRDIARVIGVDLSLADQLSKLVEVKFGKVYSIDDMLAMEGEFKDIVNANPQLGRLVELVKKISGNARHVSIHASGFIVTPDPIVNYVPLQLETRGSNKIITQFEMTAAEYIGLMKFDFLGLANLTIIGNTLKYIKDQRGEDIDIDKIPLDDPKSYKVFQEGRTTAIFQFESGGMRRYLRDLQPNNIEDLIFMAAAYRPGPMEFIPNYIDRKFKREEVKYVDDALKDILEQTYGIMIYQEQILNIAVQYAGYTQGAADLLRRAMGKKKPELMAKERAIFVERALTMKRDEKKANDVFTDMEKFANYGFNRSHSAAYAIIAYQTAYLKANYPLEFLAGLMATDLGAADKLHRDLAEARELGVSILPPSVNHSDYEFTIEGEAAIRFGLGGIKGGGVKVMQAIVDERRRGGTFKDLDDLVRRVGPQNLSRKDLECLAKVGAMDGFGQRNAILAIIPVVMDQEQKQQQMKTVGQMGLFGGEDITTTTPLPKLNALPAAQLIAWEKEMLGVFLSQHPITEHVGIWLTNEITPLGELYKLRSGSKVRVVAMFEDIKTIRAKKSGQSMAFATLTDLTGRVEGVLFPEAYKQYGLRLAEVQAYIIVGTLQLRGDELPSITIDQVQDIENLKMPERVQIDITQVHDQDELAALKPAFAEDGNIQVDVWYGTQFKPKHLQRKLHSNNLNAVMSIRKYLVRGKSTPM